MCSRYRPKRKDAKILLGEKILIYGSWPYDDVRPTDNAPIIIPGSDEFFLTTTPNDTVSPYHARMPFILSNDMAAAWLGADWGNVLEHPDKSPLEKIKKQGELF